MWQLEEGRLTSVGVVDLGWFNSSGVYVIQYSYLKQSSLYTWMEGAIYVWVGEEVIGDRRVLINQALNKMTSVVQTKLVSLSIE